MNISLIVPEQTEEAKRIVLQGFKERFGTIIDGLNPDLDDIMAYYRGDKFFYVGHYKDQLIATGGFVFETPSECRVVRMSVLSSFRNLGFGRMMLSFLEVEAQKRNAVSMVLETNQEWEDAIHFYQRNGYTPYLAEGERIHFRKKLPA
ncbi:GNAT family N-acetyltransferase [Bacillus salacetis]|uniref:GNAT family N-acetyltransferase n=1 Tax=Bacillus salacetis TaxID=2315464 RepID=UPI003B9F5A70